MPEAKKTPPLKINPAVIADQQINSFSARLQEKCIRDTSNTNNALLGYNLSQFNNLALYLDGIQQGLYIIGAETNIGKTSFMINLFLDLLRSNPTVSGLFISLDDNFDTIVSRMLAILSNLEINMVQKPCRLSSDDRIELTLKGYCVLDKLGKEKRLEIKDSSELSTAYDLEKIMKQYSSENKNLVVFIDGIHSLESSHDSIREENIMRANVLKHLVDNV